MKKVNKLSLIILICIFSFSCKYDFNFIPREYDIETRSPSFTNLNETGNNPDTKSLNRFSVLLIGDTHFGRDGWFKPKRDENPFYEKLEQIAQSESSDAPLMFCINVGDNSDSGKQSEFDTNKEFSDRISSILKASSENADGRTYSIVGNHDLYNDGWENWKKNCFPNTSTYFFKTEGTGCSLSWYFLDSGSGMIGANQMDQFEALTTADSNKKIVFSHYPINAKNVTYYSLSNPIEIARLNKIFYRNNIKLSLEGHFHPGGQNDIKTDSGDLIFHEEVVSGFVDKKSFYILTIDLSNSEPQYEIKKYTF